ncbi:Uncharacterised protein [Klebsiella pneumoniae]|nr:Uncharacterised protein [Klebsiella pneumoniae]
MEFKVHPFTEESCTVQTRAFIHQITCEGIHAAVATGTPEERIEWLTGFCSHSISSTRHLCDRVSENQSFRVGKQSKLVIFPHWVEL